MLVSIPRFGFPMVSAFAEIVPGLVEDEGSRWAARYAT
jgi:hypothetical protein